MKTILFRSLLALVSPIAIFAICDGRIHLAFACNCGCPCQISKSYRGPCAMCRHGIHEPANARVAAWKRVIGRTKS